MIGADTTAKVFLVVTIVAAFVGAYRLTIAAAGSSQATTARRAPPVEIAALGAAVLYGCGPFLLTRLAVGHWPVVLVMAALPWALPTLAEPRSLRRVAAVGLVFSIGGVYGGIVGGAFLLVGILDLRRWVALRAAGVWFLAQLVWLVPLGIVAVTSPGRTMAVSDVFATPLDGVGDLGRIFAGLGFWNLGFQLAREQPLLAAVTGFVLVGLMAVGTPEIPRRWRRPLVAVGALSLALAVVSSIPGIEGLYASFTATVLGAPLREGQRNLAPFLLWAAVAASLGARRVARRLPGVAALPVAAVPVVLAVVLIAPFWGLEGQLRPVQLPSEWAEARALVQAEPGTVMALPWFQYFTADVADDRLVLSPIALYLGGDVVAASDPRLSREPAQEVADAREPFFAAVVDDLRGGRASSEALADLGVRWVFRLHDVDWRDYTGLDADAGLEVAVDGESLTLYRVTGWAGTVVDDDGVVVPSDSIVGPLRSVDASGPAVVAAPSQRGWMRGLAPAGATADGRISIPAGSGHLWYLPAVAVVVADAVWVGLVAWTVVPPARRRWVHRRRRSPPVQGSA